MSAANEKLFYELVDKYKASIWRVCHAYLPDRSFAEDVYQDVLMELWKNLGKFRGESGWHTYIYRIAVNTAISHGRREKRRVVDFREQPAETADTSATDTHDTEQLHRRLHTCIARLPEQDRLVVSLLLEDLSYAEIADVTGLSVSNVGVRINRIKPKLHACITSGN
ncbi:MAG: sigma-70 family RNA polymerase sigma factor [Bacteroidia bacterium]|jgi:RNA polymerase sigma-70 factor (ECF subfamily)|nr:sigma-70 family RNA polymerase sigma factor [Bacteroidia bacterium]